MSEAMNRRKARQNAQKKEFDIRFLVVVVPAFLVVVVRAIVGYLWGYDDESDDDDVKRVESGGGEATK
jgi:hypothetical protein